MKKTLRILGVLVGVIVAFEVAFISGNLLTSANYDELNETDKQLILEMDNLTKAEEGTSAWDGYKVTEHPVFALKGTLDDGYLINPTSEPHSIFAKKIELPSSMNVSVYRVAGLSPDMMQFIIPAKFNSIGQHCNVAGSDVYFVRYDESSLSKNYDSYHFTTLLAHESFHYFMQENWTGPSRFETEGLTDTDLNLLEAEYAVFDSMMDELASPSASKQAMISLVDNYLSAVDARIVNNAAYMKEELAAETIEGTATYVGAKASEFAGYNFKVMWFADSNGEATELSFASLVPLMREGTLDKSTITTDWTYQSGALLCQVMDYLEAPNWQQKLNSQTGDKPLTLYDILKDFRASI